MKISIITVCFNSEATIRDTIESVLAQDYADLEYIIIDGASTDGTLKIIDEYRDRIATVVSEPDNGIYDAMNKGIAKATGDVVGILNSDDFYVDSSVLAKVAVELEQKKVDSVFADLVVVDQVRIDKIVRYYRANHFTPARFAYGWMPPHPTFFVKRSCYEKFGTYRTDYQIAADYELLVRFLVVSVVSYSYLPQVLIKMRTGGVSSRNLKSNWILNKEIVRACRENGISTNLCKVLCKYPRKILEMISRPGNG